MAQETADTDVPGRDTIAVLYPYDVSAGVRTGAHPGKTFTVGDKLNYTQGRYFQGEDVSFSSVLEMHEVLVSIADAGLAFPVRGQRAHTSTYLRRCKVNKGTTPRGLQGAKLHVLPADCDKWPNIDGFDPRTDPHGAWRWMLAILGPEFVDVEVSAHWSSSCCVRTPAGVPPETLDARFWLRMDKAVGELGCRQILKAIDARVKAYYACRGIVFDKLKHPVDPKVADIQQPIYVATPRFEGVTDPLPGIRHAFLAGSRAEVCTASIWSEINQVDDVTAATAESDRPAKEKTTKVPRIRKARVPGTVLPLAASGRLIAAQRNLLSAALAGTGSPEYLDACTHLYHRRMALELVALAGHRGGAPEGERDHVATRIASALVASLPLGWPVDRVRSEIRQLLIPVCGTEWVQGEWEAGCFDAAIMERYLRASRGERSKNGRDLRYTYSKARLLEEWSPTYEEVVELGLRSLCTDADRVAADREEARQAAGSKARDEWLAEARKHAPAVHRLHAEGLSARKTATRLGLPVAKVLRLLKLDADTVAELGKPALQADVATLEQPAAAADDIVIIQGSIRYLTASQGMTEAWEFAAALGEPIEWVENVMSGMAATVAKIPMEPLRLAA